MCIIRKMYFRTPRSCCSYISMWSVCLCVCVTRCKQKLLMRNTQFSSTYIYIDTCMFHTNAINQNWGILFVHDRQNYNPMIWLPKPPSNAFLHVIPTQMHTIHSCSRRVNQPWLALWPFGAWIYSSIRWTVFVYKYNAWNKKTYQCENAHANRPIWYFILFTAPAAPIRFISISSFIRTSHIIRISAICSSSQHYALFYPHQFNSPFRLLIFFFVQHIILVVIYRCTHFRFIPTYPTSVLKIYIFATANACVVRICLCVVCMCECATFTSCPISRMPMPCHARTIRIYIHIRHAIRIACLFCTQIKCAVCTWWRTRKKKKRSQELHERCERDEANTNTNKIEETTKRSSKRQSKIIQRQNTVVYICNVAECTARYFRWRENEK